MESKKQPKTSKGSKPPIKSFPQPIFYIKKNTIFDKFDKKAKNIAVSASKKEFKNAIRRNKVRRRIKEAYREVVKEISGFSPKNTPQIKINAKIGALKADFKNIKEIIKREINK